MIGSCGAASSTRGVHAVKSAITAKGETFAKKASRIIVVVFTEIRAAENSIALYEGPGAERHGLLFFAIAFLDLARDALGQIFGDT